MESGWGREGRGGCACFREAPRLMFLFLTLPKFTHAFHPHSALDQQTGAGTSSASSRRELLVNGSPEAPSQAEVVKI